MAIIGYHKRHKCRLVWALLHGLKSETISCLRFEGAGVLALTHSSRCSPYTGCIDIYIYVTYVCMSSNLWPHGR